MSTNHFSSDLSESQWSNANSNPHQQEDPSRHPHSRTHFIPQFYQDTHHSSHAHHSLQPWQLNSQYPTTHNRTPTTTLNFNLNHHNAVNPNESDQLQSPPRHHRIYFDDSDDEKEPMFEKPLTPSDVGKLNRLVIPKQHAEKYFPLGGGDSGLLLSFEDESWKSWRFRYSYWNSSQSYVLTKGWSRYVKEKRLNAGDVVLFERHRANTDRLFIGCRRRNDSGAGGVESSGGGVAGSSNGGGGGWTRMFYSAPHHGLTYPAHQYHHSVAPYPPDSLHAAGSPVQNVNQTASVGNSKTLRLFGVNLECQQQAAEHDESEPSTSDLRWLVPDTVNVEPGSDSRPSSIVPSCCL